MRLVTALLVSGILLTGNCQDTRYFDKEYHIHFVVELDGYYNFSRWILLPEKKLILLLFFNPEAYIETDAGKLQDTSFISPEAIEAYRRQGWKEKLEAFTIITGKKATSQILMDQKKFLRLIDYLGGVKVFLPVKPGYVDPEMYYFAGVNHLYSDGAGELILSLEKHDPGEYPVASQNRHFYFETLLLNFLYRLRFQKELLEKENRWQVIYRFFQTDLSSEDVKKVFLSFMNYDMQVVEFPLQVVRIPYSVTGYMFLNIPKSQEMWESSLKKITEGEEAKLTLEILNATGRNRLASQLKSILDAGSYRVLNTDNFPGKLTETVLISNNGNTAAIAEFRKIFSIDEKNIYFYKRTKDAELTLILGDDFHFQKLIRR